jgi:hypothetical protein
MDSSSIVVPADFIPELDVSARRSTWRSMSKRLTHEVVCTRLQEGRVEGSSVTVIGCVNGPRLIDAQPIGLRILCYKDAFDDGFPQFLGEPAPVRENQGETIPLVTQVGITFHCDDEGELWPRVEPIFFKDRWHISERVGRDVPGGKQGRAQFEYIASVSWVETSVQARV